MRSAGSPDALGPRWFRARRADVPLARWLRLVTPGMLVTRSVVILALILAPSFTRLVCVDEPVRSVAVALLLAHIVTGALVVRCPWRRLAVAVAGAMLGVDALLSGVMLGAVTRMASPAIAVGVVVLAIGLQSGGWRAVCACVLGIGFGAAAAMWSEIGSPLVFSPAVSYSSALNVETSFAGTSAIGAGGWQFSTVLDVDTSFAGTAALVPPAYHFTTRLDVDTSFAGGPAMGLPAPLFVPALLLACIALCVGNGVSLVRVRRERHRTTEDRGRGGMPAMKMLLLCIVAAALLCTTRAAAECQPSGRNLFAAGLEALSAGDVSAATKSFYILVETQPDCAEAHNNLAVAFVEEGRLDEAKVQLHAALRVRPDYPLARRNLVRLDAMLAARAQGSAAAQLAVPPQGGAETEAVAAPEPVVQIAVPSPPAQPAALARADALPKRPSPTSIATTTPTASGGSGVNQRPTTVCIIEPEQSRVCVEERDGTNGASAESCYPIQAAAVSTWPRWLVASEVTGNRIRLLDESGQTRLEIVAGDTSATSDVLRLQQSDFEALAPHILPWWTKWVVLD